MKRVSLLLLGLAVLFGLSMTAFADSTDILFTGVSGPNAGGVYTGIYYGTLNNGMANAVPNSPFICDDYPDEITEGDSWTATVSSLTNLGTTRFMPTYLNDPSLTQIQAYSEVAWLAENLLYGAGTNGTTDNDPNGISWAIWYILDNPDMTRLDPGTLSEVNNYVTAANSWLDGLPAACRANPIACGDVRNIYIYTPPTGVTSQEFLGPTPEPLSMILMGTFLSLAGLGVGKKKLMS